MKLRIIFISIIFSTVNLFGSTTQLINGNINKVEIANSSNNISYPTDIDFNPQIPGQLWVLNHGLENGGTTVIIDRPGTDESSFDYRKDGNAWHFMVYATALAFGDTAWATAQDYFNANRGNFGGWCGPSLWPSDLSVYAIYGNPPSNGANGSHYDMVHQSPYSSGIAFEKDLTYWVNEGEYGTICKYNFGEGHVAGGADHSDAEVFRYVDIPYEMNAGVPAHMVIKENWLYYVNPGKRTINRFDITTGTIGNSLANAANGNEGMKKFVEVKGGVWEEFITEGLVSPSGIDIQGDKLIVSDNASGDILIYDIANDKPTLKKILKTGSESIMGIKFDSKGDIYYVDHLANKVFKLEGNSGINYYPKSNVHNSNDLEGNGFFIMIENNSDTELIVNDINVSFKNIAESKLKNLTFKYYKTDFLPFSVSANSSLEFQIAYDVTSGYGIYDIIVQLEFDNNSVLSEPEIDVIGITDDIPLIIVNDDSPQNVSNSDLTTLLNSSNYQDYMDMNTIDFQKYAHLARGALTAIWNAGSFGTTNAQEYYNFDRLRENGTSLYYLGDGPMFLVGAISPESNFNLSAFGAEYVGPIFQGFSTGGNYTMNGVSGDNVTNSYQNVINKLTLYTTQNGTSAWPTSYIKPLANSYSIFNHSISTDSVIAIRNENNNSRSVIQSFNMYNISNIDSRANIFKSIMDWLTYKNTTGIFELAKYQELNIYPNPTTDYIYLENQEFSLGTKIQLLDIAGRIIRVIDNSNSNIDVSDLRSGTYFFLIENNKEVKFAKFIKQ